MIIQYLLGFFIAAGSGMAMAGLWNLIFDTADQPRRAFVMGFGAIIWMISWTLSSVIANSLNSYYIALPLQIAAILMFVSASRVWFFKKAITNSLSTELSP